MRRSEPIVHAETFTRERDRIEFAIRVVRAEGALFGTWSCLACGDHGGSSQMENEIKWAVHSARTNLGGHACKPRGWRKRSAS
jgi:hypothetical protein